MKKGEYELVESDRAKNLRITVHPDGRVVVTKPSRISIVQAEAFLGKKAEWISKMVAKVERRRKKYGEPVSLPRLRRGTPLYRETVASARALASHRLEFFNNIYGFAYGRISIRNQKGRWGSCSAQNTLSFNLRLPHLPSELADYIVVHELCHTKHHNHSEAFWTEVARAMPNHKLLRAKLKVFQF